MFVTQFNIYGAAFLRKRLTAKSPELILEKGSTIDFSLGSTCGSWQYCQKIKQKK